MQSVIYPHTYSPLWQGPVATSGELAYPSAQHSTAYPYYFHAPQIEGHFNTISLSRHDYDQGCWAGFHEGFQPLSTLPPAGHESFPLDSIQGPTYVSVEDMATAHNSESWTVHLSTGTSAFSDSSYQDAPVDMTPLVSSPPTLFPSIAGHEEASSAHSGEDTDKPFKCRYPGCRKWFKKKSSAERHYRKNHSANPCLFFFSSTRCDFEYGGPYDYRRHLEVKHNMKNKLIDGILGKTAKSRGKATIIGRDRHLLPL